MSQKRATRGGTALALLAAGIMGWAGTAGAQYFGRNKVNYETFDFQVLHTPHFDIYFYPRDNEAANDAARMAERWYHRYSPVFSQEFEKKKPIILYSDQADFQQTNVVDEFLSDATGGLTEPIKNRIIMPFTGDYAGTDHVLGHEIVHQFQFDIAFATNDTIPFRVNLLPSWLIEGMAEYLSVGRDDPHTAMWMRDACLQKKFPTLEQLSTDPRFFPYRYGEALWAYVGGRWGDDTIGDIYRAAGRRGMEFAFAKVLHVTADSLGAMWAKDLKAYYLPAMAGRAKPGETGKKILAPDMDAKGDINLDPVLSPDGKRVAFLSERDLFSIDLFVADAATGKVERKLVSSSTNSHFDALRFIDSAGSWSPDGKRLAVVAFAKGNNEILLIDSHNGKITGTIRPKAVGAISNPAWSPDGLRIAFSGSSEGRSDLFLADVKGGKIERITDDRYADLQPTWSPDGKSLAFVTDRGPGTDFTTLTYSPMRIGILTLADRGIRLISPFEGHKHINPQYSPDGTSLYFISDRQGFSDVYRVDLASGDVYQITRMATGVSGITALSPAMSVALDRGNMMFSAFENAKYIVYSLEPGEIAGTPVRETPEPAAAPPDTLVAAVLDTLEMERGAALPSVLSLTGIPAERDSSGAAGAALSTLPAAFPDTAGAVATVAAAAGPDTAAAAPPDTAAVDTVEAAPVHDRPDWAGLLPPAEERGSARVSDYLADPEGNLPVSGDYPIAKYRPKLSLDYVGAFAGGGIAVDRFGAAVGGGATAYFSDMLGNHTVGAALEANGTVKDIGGQAFYLNRSHRVNWGGVIGHIPFLDLYSSVFTRGDTLVVQDERDRIYLDRASVFVAYPFSPIRRLEVSSGYTHYGFDYEVQEQRLLPSGVWTDPTTHSLPSEGDLNLIQSSVALVGDDSFFGFTSPVQGYRYRVEFEPTFGTLSYNSFLVDYRRYVRMKPFTLAARGLHLGRYGPDSRNPRLTDLFIGYATLVRGYSSGSFDPQTECPPGQECVAFDRLRGSRIGVANLEVRLPLFGTSQFGLINFPYLPTELSWFFDGGLAWNPGDDVKFRFETNESRLGSSLYRYPVFSTGGSLRFNLLNALVLEAYLAFPFQRPAKETEFGIQIAPGW
jgi:Omp85 superfamily domain/WD40-like Beta Propeller Repeat